MNVLPEAVWLQNDETKALVVASFNEAKGMYSKDMRMLLGRDITDPEKLAEILNEATGVGVVPEYASTGVIDSMFSDVPTLSPTPVVEVDFGALLDDTSSSPTVVETETVVVKESEVLSAASSDPLASGTVTATESVNFDELLAD
jgi:hypothetical protein